MTAEKEDPNLRSVNGYFIRPRQQVKYAMLFMGGAMLTVVALIGLLIVSFNHALARYNAKFLGDSDVGLTISDTFTQSFFVIVAFAVVAGGFSIWLGIRMSHRIWGPMIPVRRHIDKLAAGDYSSRMRLRKTDELVELCDALNVLAEALEKRHGKP